MNINESKWKCFFFFCKRKKLLPTSTRCIHRNIIFFMNLVYNNNGKWKISFQEFSFFYFQYFFFAFSIFFRIFLIWINVLLHDTLLLSFAISLSHCYTLTILHWDKIGSNKRMYSWQANIFVEFVEQPTVKIFLFLPFYIHFIFFFFSCVSSFSMACNNKK